MTKIFDKIFLIIFILLLLIPVLKINNQDISKIENRKLTTWKPLINKSKKINYNFGNDYENWLKDRFLGRQRLIHLYKNIIYNITILSYRDKNICINKKENYILGCSYKIKFEKENIDEIGRNLSNFNIYLNNKNIKFYVVIVPLGSSFFINKNVIFKQNTDVFNKINFENNRLMKYLSEKYKINLVYVDNELYKMNENNLVYYKTDHHMTDLGYYYTYKKLISKIKKDFPDISITPLNDFKISRNKLVRYNYERTFEYGSEQRISNVFNKKISDTDYVYLDYKNLSNIISKKTSNHEEIHKNPNGKYRVLLVGDSFIIGFIHFLDTNFAEINSLRINMWTTPFDVKILYKKINNFKPDIVIFFRHSWGIENFKYMYSD